MSRALAGLAVLVCGVLLASCSWIPQGILEPSYQRADARMEQIVEALNDQDAAALKDMFSPYAVERATDLDEGLEYLLSTFPDGDVSWERYSVGREGQVSGGNRTELLRANYIVSANGQDYWFFFADVTVNEVVNQENVGIYAMGATPWAEDLSSGPTGEFVDWSNAIHLDGDDEYGYPGVYLPASG